MEHAHGAIGRRAGRGPQGAGAALNPVAKIGSGAKAQLDGAAVLQSEPRQGPNSPLQGLESAQSWRPP
eukprot:14367596-Alexandrium_andersonii.AAC.1